ncbi:MAG: hypothetical protein WAZ21_04630 [Candidatus Saccharimonadales bacterium]
MRSTKSIRRDIQFYTSMSAITLGCTIFFAAACFTYLTFLNAACAMLFLVGTAVLIGRSVRYGFEHYEATVAQSAQAHPGAGDRNR